MVCINCLNFYDDHAGFLRPYYYIIEQIGLEVIKIIDIFLKFVLIIILKPENYFFFFSYEKKRESYNFMINN